MKSDWQKGIDILKNDGVVVLPTDTLYGIIGSAMSRKAVEKIYKIKGRNGNKPFIVLITSYKDLELFGIKLNEVLAKILKKFWPGQVSVLLSCKSLKFKYIHRSTNEIAFRMVGKKNLNLFDLINKVGPLVAPSANKEGEKPAENITKAKNYFGDKVDLYISTGKRMGSSSTLVRIKDDNTEILRQGKVIIK